MTEIKIESTTLKLVFSDDVTFSIDVAEAQYTLDAAATQATQDFPDDPIEQDRAFFAQFAGVVEDKTGHLISMSQAERAVSAIQQAHVEYKKKLDDTPTLPTTTNSTPSE